MDISAILLSLVDYGYVGAFLVSFLSSALIFVPLPHLGIIFLMAAFLDPILLIIITAVGATLGEFVAYAIGYGSRKVLKKKYKKQFELAERWFTKNGFLTIFAFAATPLPDDVVGLIGGSANYDKRKYLLSCFLGKMVLSTIIVYAGSLSLNTIMNLLVT